MPVSFTVLGHACMVVDADGRRLLIDPWLIGSCYWRSWWHFPKPVEVTPELFNVDAIYLTHGHFDHLHFPSLRKFDRAVKIVIPKFITDRMSGSVRSMRFENVIELPHGHGYSVDQDFTIHSYQYGFDDSAVIINAGGTTILNLNDSHVTGLPLRQILKRHPRIDFLLRSHAPAQGYPVCYDADDRAELEFHRREDYIVRFLNSIRIVKPRYAVPFASNICHLHNETVKFNRDLITPFEVARAAQEAFGPKTPVVVMTPGDSWNSSSGFRLTDPETYLDSSAVVAGLTESVRPTLEATYADEDKVQPDFNLFRTYIGSFIKALPWGIRLLFRPVIVFDQPKAAHRYWVIDFRRHSIYESDAIPEGANSIIQVHPAVLMNAVSNGILFFVHISKRMRIHVHRGGMKEDFKFWGLVQLYEIGYLPLRNLASPRALLVMWRRRLEILEALRSALRGGRFEEKAVPQVY